MSEWLGRIQRRGWGALRRGRAWRDRHPGLSWIGSGVDVVVLPTIFASVPFFADALQETRKTSNLNIFAIIFLGCLVLSVVRKATSWLLGSPSISLQELGTILTRATDAIHKSQAYARNPVQDELDLEHWIGEYRAFEEVLLSGLRETCGGEVTFTTNVMYFLPRQPDETMAQWTDSLNFIAREILRLPTNFHDEYPEQQGNIEQESQLRGEVLMIIKTAGSKEPHIRIPVNKHQSKVLLGAPAVVDKLLTQQLEPNTQDIACHPAYAYAYYPDTHNLTDQDFGADVGDQAKRRVRSYFSQSAIHSLISIAFTPDHNALEDALRHAQEVAKARAVSTDPGSYHAAPTLYPPLAVLNINASKPDALKNKKVETLVLQSLQVYALSLSGWLANFHRFYHDKLMKLAIHNSGGLND